ncbi:peptidoglycan-binding domain-containing protein [Paraliomyxa miuraensis]|uniref:peptidoglycan-binding domain-containing protein n=1 Tax=Paraliomyxa miuraensis TaxID=376150 RepID=UPI00224E9C95|nr:peptidoglycan-binding protein [Paraliomyxa miuraensis]MCX4241748.1 hypothetical protein [Paraliomyxa miuraensis]
MVLSLEPADAEPYVLVFSGKRVEGKTDSNGLLEVVIPTSVRVADLLLPEREMKFHLQIGDLEPANTTRGLQSRLTNLSLFMGNSNGDLDGTTRAEILHFQSANDIDPSGGHDEETTAALADMHGV